MITLENCRALKPEEIIRKGDLCQKNDRIWPVSGSIGDTVNEWTGWTFWRRKHTKKVTSVMGESKSKKTPVVAVVSFDYPHEGRQVTRMVHVISLDDRYLTGLERTCLGYGKYKYRFKRFLVTKMGNEPKLRYYGPNTK